MRPQARGPPSVRGAFCTLSCDESVVNGVTPRVELACFTARLIFFLLAACSHGVIYPSRHGLPGFTFHVECSTRFAVRCVRLFHDPMYAVQDSALYFSSLDCIAKFKDRFQQS